MKKNYIFKVIFYYYIAKFIFQISKDNGFFNSITTQNVAVFIVIGFFGAYQIYKNYFLKKNESTFLEDSNEELAEVVTLKECPSCNEMTDSSNPLCSHCGINMTNDLECDYCSHMNPNNLTKCEECGALLV